MIFRLDAIVTNAVDLFMEHMRNRKRASPALSTRSLGLASASDLRTDSRGKSRIEGSSSQRCAQRSQNLFSSRRRQFSLKLFLHFYHN